MKPLLAITALLLVGCDHPGTQPPPRKPAPPEPARTDYGRGYLKTISHDGHIYVVMDGYKQGSLVHHPDCPCLKTK